MDWKEALIYESTRLLLSIVHYYLLIFFLFSCYFSGWRLVVLFFPVCLLLQFVIWITNILSCIFVLEEEGTGQTCSLAPVRILTNHEWCNDDVWGSHYACQDKYGRRQKRERGEEEERMENCLEAPRGTTRFAWFNAEKHSHYLIHAKWYLF